MFRKLDELLHSQLPMGQGVQESNPQPMVLETIALPIELTPYKNTYRAPNGFRDVRCAACIARNICLIQAFPDHSAGSFP